LWVWWAQQTNQFPHADGISMPIEINTDTIAEAIVTRLVDCGILVPRLLTLDQAATYLGLTKNALKAKVHLGRVPTVELDKKLRFDRHDLDKMIEKRKRVE
jgi:excisionase family DNA binding protein